MTISKKKLVAEVKRLSKKQQWWHDIELPYGVRTINRNASNRKENNDVVKWKRISTLIEFEGKRVLDVACNDGYYSLMAEQSGAKEVFAIDIDNGRIEKARFIKRVLDLKNIKIEHLSAYHLPGVIKKKYDIVFCLGLLHRTPDPYGLIAALLQVGDTVIIEWPALLSRRADARFWSGHVKNDFFNTGYWELSRVCMKSLLNRMGIEHVVDANPYSKRALFIVTNSSEIYSHALERKERLKISHIVSFKFREFREAVKTFMLNIGILS